MHIQAYMYSIQMGKLDKMGYHVPQALRTMSYARNVSDRKLNNYVSI